MPLQIPDVVAAYIAAEQIKDAHALASCFSDEGVVHDESHNHCGHAEIQRWKEEADMKYSYTSEPLESSTNENVVTIRSRLTGSFPGSAVELSQVFVIANGKILSLEIHS